MNPTTDFDTLRTLAEQAALRGGELARQAFGQRHDVQRKPDASEVTPVDLAVEHAVMSDLAAARPRDTFLGEEGVAATRPDAAGVVWAIDPIDGTRNFIRGVPLFTCSVAAMLHGEPVAAAIYEPMAAALYSAHRGGGSSLRYAVVEPPDDSRASAPAAEPRQPSARGDAATRGGRLWIPPDQAVAQPPGISPDPRSARPDPDMPPIVAIPSAWKAESAAMVRRICETCIVRCLGCATLHLLFVATGGHDATFLNNCKLWDIAAGWLIAREAGALVTRPDGSPLFPLDVESYAGLDLPTLAGRPAVHQQLVQLWATGQSAIE